MTNFRLYLFRGIVICFLCLTVVNIHAQSFRGVVNKLECKAAKEYFNDNKLYHHFDKASYKNYPSLIQIADSLESVFHILEEKCIDYSDDLIAPVFEYVIERLNKWNRIKDSCIKIRQDYAHLIYISTTVSYREEIREVAIELLERIEMDWLINCTTHQRKNIVDTSGKQLNTITQKQDTNKSANKDTTQNLISPPLDTIFSNKNDTKKSSRYNKSRFNLIIGGYFLAILGLIIFLIIRYNKLKYSLEELYEQQKMYISEKALCKTIKGLKNDIDLKILKERLLLINQTFFPKTSWVNILNPQKKVLFFIKTIISPIVRNNTSFKQTLQVDSTLNLKNTYILIVICLQFILEDQENNIFDEILLKNLDSNKIVLDIYLRKNNPHLGIHYELLDAYLTDVTAETSIQLSKHIATNSFILNFG